MPERSQALTLAPLLLFLALPACGDFAAGMEAYEEGRYRDAHAIFVAAEQADGEEAPAALVYNRALAALRAGEARDAKAAAERAAARGGETIAPWCAFLEGNAAYAICELAERQASTAAAEPFAFDIAIRYAETARRRWEAAAMTRDDWPEARRNVERALRKLEELERKKAEREEQDRQRSEPKPRPRPLPKPPPLPADGPPEETDADVRPQLGELSPEQVRALLETLAAKEKEKLALRQAHRKERMAAVERDW